jgi:tetratricopeptide (TPR) repeat protein
MASAPFVQLAGNLVSAMGQELGAAKPIEEGLLLTTGDGFLFAFLEDPTKVSLETVRRLGGGGDGLTPRVVVLTPGRLPLLISQEVVRRGGTVVEGPRFAELARQLGLASLLGEEPRAAPKGRPRLLPSAQQLDDVMHRAQTWLDWGVPALALRFYRQSANLKPEFHPAKIGIGRSLLALGLSDDADRQFDEVLAARPEDVEARLGKAAVLGAKSQPKREVEVYRELLAEDEARTEVRAHLVAALVDLGDWPSARIEIEAMLSRTPEDPQLRFLHSVALTRTGRADLGGEEREEARRLGLPFDREVSLCEHLGLPAPEAPATPAGAPAARRPPAPRAAAQPARGSSKARRRAAPARASRSRRRRSRAATRKGK